MFKAMGSSPITGKAVCIPLTVTVIQMPPIISELLPVLSHFINHCNSSKINTWLVNTFDTMHDNYLYKRGVIRESNQLHLFFFQRSFCDLI